jgi:hypothetical protein
MTHTTIELDPATRTPSRPARIGRLILSGLTGFVGLLVALAGIAAVSVYFTARDDDGYYTADTQLQSASYALTTGKIDLAGVVPDDVLGTVRIQAEADGGKPLFVGVAPTADAERYLRGVQHSQIDDYRDHGDATYTELGGHAPRTRPADQSFWISQSEGSGQRTLEWDTGSGDWTLVAMNPDGSAGLALAADVGTKFGWLVWAGLGVALVGFALVGGAVALARGGRART